MGIFDSLFMELTNPFVESSFISRLGSARREPTPDRLQGLRGTEFLEEFADIVGDIPRQEVPDPNQELVDFIQNILNQGLPAEEEQEPRLPVPGLPEEEEPTEITGLDLNDPALGFSPGQRVTFGGVPGSVFVNAAGDLQFGPSAPPAPSIPGTTSGGAGGNRTTTGGGSGNSSGGPSSSGGSSVPGTAGGGGAGGDRTTTSGGSSGGSGSRPPVTGFPDLRRTPTIADMLLKLGKLDPFGGL